MKRHTPTLPVHTRRKTRHKRKLRVEVKQDVCDFCFADLPTEKLAYETIKERIHAFKMMQVGDYEKGRKGWFVIYTFHVDNQAHQSWAFFYKKSTARDFGRAMRASNFRVVDILQASITHLMHKSERLRDQRGA